MSKFKGLEQHKANREAVDRIHKLIGQLSDEVNFLGDQDGLAVAFSSALQKQHRTLQQLIVELLVNGLSRYGEVAGTDARNEQAVEFCKNLDKIDLPLI